MSPGFRDETWRLARERDAAALEHAAELLLQGADGLEYEGHRARAFALAVQSQPARALEELKAGWTEEWPFPAAYTVDLARVHFLAGEPKQALTALRLGVRGLERVDPAFIELACECVRARRQLWYEGLRVALAGGSALQRLRGSGAVLRCTIFG